MEAIFSRIFVGHLEKIRALGIDPIVVFTQKPANHTLSILIKRKLEQLSVTCLDYSMNRLKAKWFLQKLKFQGYRYYEIAGWFRFFDKNVRYLERLSFSQKYSIADAIFDTMDYQVFEHPTHLEFSQDEDSVARSQLKSIGVRDEFICIHPRDDKFHGTTEPQRNIPFSNFVPACRLLAKSNLDILKMGIRQDSVNSEGIPGLINYAESYRSDFLDIWTIANAKFYLGSNSGLFYVATWFDTPVAIVNYAGITVHNFYMI
jgi:hypothetical protein